MAAPLAIFAFEAEFGFVRLAGFERVLPGCDGVVAVFGVNPGEPAGAEQILLRGSKIRDSLAVEVIEEAIGGGGPNHLGNAFGEEAVAGFYLLALGDVFDDGDDEGGLTGFVALQCGGGADPEQRAGFAEITLLEAAGIVRAGNERGEESLGGGYIVRVCEGGGIVGQQFLRGVAQHLLKGLVGFGDEAVGGKEDHADGGSGEGEGEAEFGFEELFVEFLTFVKEELNIG